MARFLLTWELGGKLGHMAHLRPVARARPVDYGSLIAELLQPDGKWIVSTRALAEKYREFKPSQVTERVVEAAEELASEAARS